jgi:hypothetical protein
MPDLASILERESRTIEVPDDFERLVWRRNRRRRNRRIGAVVVALTLSSVAIFGLVRAFEAREHTIPLVTPPPTVLAACPPGSMPNEPGPVEQVRPSSDFYMPMGFDSGSGRVVLLRARVDAPPSTWTFDVCTNTWQQMSPDQEPVGGRAWGPIAYDADSDLTITVLEGGSVWAYDVESDAWTERAHAPFDNAGYAASRMAYDPLSGLVWVRGEGSPSGPWMLWTYDVETDTWVEVQQLNAPAAGDLGPGDHQLFAFDASVDRFVVFAADHRTWTFDPRTGRWTQMSAIAPRFNTGYFASGGEAAYDEAAERTVVFSDGFVAAYDAAGDRWVRLDGRSRCCQEGPLNRLGHWMVYDPVNERLVVYGSRARVGPDGAWSSMDDAWAFDAGSRDWIPLLVRSEPEGG